MPQLHDTKGVVESLVRLRRVERSSDDSVRSDLGPVLTYLEDVVGPTVKRSEAARLLGISHTALDRWIGKGDIAAVITPGGRREIPLSQVLSLLEALDEDGRPKRPSLADVMRDRRRRAELIDGEHLLPRPRSPRIHRTAELHALAYHRAVAGRLDTRIVSDARKRLRRWRDEGRVDLRWIDEWERILDLPPSRIVRIISADGERG